MDSTTATARRPIRTATKYEGTYADGQREGEGTYTYANGAVYTGEWKDGAMEGQGVFTSEAGTYTGSFKAGAFDGYGVYEFANGDRYEGDYVAASARVPKRR